MGDNGIISKQLASDHSLVRSPAPPCCLSLRHAWALALLRRTLPHPRNVPLRFWRPKGPACRRARAARCTGAAGRLDVCGHRCRGGAGERGKCSIQPQRCRRTAAAAACCRCLLPPADPAPSCFCYADPAHGLPRHCAHLLQSEPDQGALLAATVNQRVRPPFAPPTPLLPLRSCPSRVSSATRRRRLSCLTAGWRKTIS